MGGGLGRFASNYRDWDPTDELDRQEHDRKILDDFFQGGEAPGLLLLVVMLLLLLLLLSFMLFILLL